MKLLSVFILAAAAVLAQPFRITNGPAAEQVLQRDASGKADAVLSGTANQEGEVEARVLRKHVLVSGWAPVGRAAAGRWTGTVKALPAGGPYRIELRIGDAAAAVDNILVGDLWVLAGQSNMEGVGDLVDVEAPHEMVHSFDMTDHWIVAEEPLHLIPGAVDPVHQQIRKMPERLTGEKLRQFIASRRKGAGLGLPFAVEMVRRTGIPIGLLPCAHGGTSMDQWDPALKSRGGESLYGAMLRRIGAVGGRVTGVLWYQGESDASPKAAPLFAGKFERFVAALREDTGQPDLPFYYVQIGRYVNDRNPAEWNAVQEAQRLAEAAIPHSGMVPAVDFSLDDGIHVGTQDHKRLGRRLANLACHDLFPAVPQCAAVRRGPHPVSATLNGPILRVAFADVNGTLRSEGRISGFSIHMPDGAPVPLIFKARVDPDDPSAVLLYLDRKPPEGATLHYGYGKDPYCNLRDSQDMAVPVFGPVPIAN